MSELSELLKSAREAQKKSIAQASSDTKIRVPFLESIENGDFNSLPSYLHAYGFVKKYAEYLGLPYDEIKVLFDAECPKNAKTSGTHKDEAAALNEEKKGGGAGKIFIVLCILAAICVAAWFAYSQFLAKKNSRPVAALVSPEPTPQKTQENKNTPKESTASAPVSPAPIQAVQAPVQSVIPETPVVPEITPAPVVQEEARADVVVSAEPVIPDSHATEVEPAATAVAETEATADTSVKRVTLSFSGDCWVRFVSDTGRTEDFVAESGTTKRLSFIKEFTIDIGNAAAISMRYGSQNFRSFGGEGSAVKGLRYSLINGVLTEVHNR